MMPCLLDVFKPTIKVAMDTYKDCMTTAGYKVPEGPPPMPGMGGAPPGDGDKKDGDKKDGDKKDGGDKPAGNATFFFE